MAVQRYVQRPEFNPDDFDECIDYDFDQLLLQGPPGGLKQRASLPETFQCKTISEFLQSWLFFGLIARVLSQKILVSNFVEDDSSFIHTRKLVTLLRDWEVKREQREYDEINRALDRASTFICSWCDRLDQSWEIPEELWLSFAIIGETLTHAQQKKTPQSITSLWIKARERKWGSNTFLHRVLQKKGWCPSTSHMLYNVFGTLSGLYITSLLTPPKVREHADPLRADRRFHEFCTLYACNENIVKEDIFPVHLTKSCLNALPHGYLKQGCRFVEVKESELDAIVDRSNIPLVRVCVDETTSLPFRESIQIKELKVSKYAGHSLHLRNPCSTPFVAISHVWSDGMGNVQGNSLPLCLLKKIQENVNELYDQEENVYFWLDTLCIPWKHEGPRRQAIRLMNEVYGQADKVLVLDDDLRQFGSRNGLEPLIRINISKWARRLWTLQEGAIGKAMYFRFQDGLTLSTHKIEDRFAAANRNVHLPWIECSRIFSPVIRSLKSRSVENPVAELWQAVQWRNSQRVEDETVCLSTLLGLDPGPLLLLPKEGSQRMCHFLSMLDETIGIPAGMIFLPGPKIDTPGFRWAVKTWMASAPREFPYPLWSLKDVPTYLTSRGLLMQCEGLRLVLENVPTQPRFWMHVYDPSGTDRWFQVRDAPEEHRHSDPKRQSMWLRHVNSSSVGLMLSNTLPQEQPEIALLVHISSERAGRKSVNIISRAWVSKVSSHGECQKLERLQSRRSSDVCVAEHIDKTQFWLIDGMLTAKHNDHPHFNSSENQPKSDSNTSFPHPPPFSILGPTAYSGSRLGGNLNVSEPALPLGVSTQIPPPPKRLKFR